MNRDNPEQLTIAPDGRPAEEQPRWRQDFPIDWPQDEYRSRRDFAKLLGLTSLAFVVGQAWIVILSLLRKARDRPLGREVAAVDELPVGGSKLFNYPRQGDLCVLVRVSADEFVAYGQRCTHLSCPVIPRPDLGRFYCPCHEGWFDLFTGQPLAGPPRRPLPYVALQVRDGRVYAIGVGEGVV